MSKANYVFRRTTYFNKKFKKLSKVNQDIASESFKEWSKDPFAQKFRPHKIEKASTKHGATVYAIVLAGNLRCLFFQEGNTIWSIDIGGHDIYESEKKSLKDYLTEAEAKNEAWNRIQGDKTNLKSGNHNVDIQFGITDFSHGQSDGYVAAYDKSSKQHYRDPIHGEANYRCVGLLNFSEYEGEIQIKFVQTDPEYQRQGIGIAMLSRLQKEYPKAEIDFGYVTDEGKALMESAEKIVIKSRNSSVGVIYSFYIGKEKIGEASTHSYSTANYNDSLEISYFGLKPKYRNLGYSSVCLELLKKIGTMGRKYVVAVIMSLVMYRSFKKVFGKPEYISDDIKEYKEKEIISYLPQFSEEDENGELRGGRRLFMRFPLK